MKSDPATTYDPRFTSTPFHFSVPCPTHSLFLDTQP